MQETGRKFTTFCWVQVFEEACRQCDAKKMHLQLLGILERSDDAQVPSPDMKLKNNSTFDAKGTVLNRVETSLLLCVLERQNIEYV